MGPSSSFKGKVGNALLEDNIIENEINKKSKKINWTTVKTAMSKYISSSGKVGTPKSIVKNYINAFGSKDRFMHNFYKRQNATFKIGNIFLGFTTRGILKTLSDLGISLQNISLDEAMSRLVNYVEESAVSKDDIAIRIATANTLNKLIQLQINVDIIDSATGIVLMEYFFTELIWQQMLIDLGYSFEKYATDNNKLIKIEKDMKEFIKATVEVAFEINKEYIFSKEMFDKVIKSCVQMWEEYKK